MLEKFTGLLLAIGIHAAIIVLLLQPTTMPLFTSAPASELTSVTAVTVEASTLDNTQFIQLAALLDNSSTPNPPITQTDLETTQREKENHESAAKTPTDQLVLRQTQIQNPEPAVTPEPAQTTALTASELTEKSEKATQQRLAAEKAAAEQKAAAEAAAKQRAAAEARHQAEKAAQQRLAAEQAAAAKRKAAEAAAAKQWAAAEARHQAEKAKQQRLAAEQAAAAKRKAAEEAAAKQRAAAEARRQAEKAKQQRLAAEQAAAAKQKAAEAAAAKQRAAAAKQRAAAQQEAARAQRKAQFVSTVIKGKVEQVWQPPLGVPKGLSCSMEITFTLSGGVQTIRTVRSSGYRLFDSAAIRAVRQAAPFPIPADLVNEVFTFNFKSND